MAETLLQEEAARRAAAERLVERFESREYRELVERQLAEIRANYTEADRAYAARYEELLYG